MHGEIFAYNFLPDPSWSSTLASAAFSASAITEIHASIGEDSPILEPDEPPQ